MDYEMTHLVVGGILYNTVILLAVLAFFTKFERRWKLFWISVVQHGLVHIQLLLGLGSNENAGLLAYHIPVGVLIFFLSSYLTVALAFGLQLQSERA